ncbi:hypothetical protein MMC13_004261 [Lambiella insularis]|nr:hypothetical protein [Lambiella insularis]
MSNQRLPSPPASLNGDYHQGMDQLLRHNAATAHRSGQYLSEDSGYPHSDQSTTHGSPAGNHWIVDQYANERQPGSCPHPDHVGLGINYDWYSSPTDSRLQSGPYLAACPGSTQLCQQVITSSPPTPSASDMSAGEHVTTRSRRPLAPNGLLQAPRLSIQGGVRATGSPKVKKAMKQTKADKTKIPKLDAPLSELTKDLTHIPIRNIEEWVNRSAEVRNQEVEQRNGYVTRPMNSFMLYRSAYSDRTKSWCTQNNHQVVSSVTGESWPMEPPHIREQYTEYARIERDNHQKAHPEYKFSPSKAQNSARKRKGGHDDTDEDEVSDHNSLDFDWTPVGARRPKTKSIKRLGREAGYPVNSGLHNEMAYGLQASGSEFNRSHYQAINAGKPLPAAMKDLEMYGQYYQTETYHRFDEPNIQDVLIRRTDGPSMQPGSTQPLVGLPGGHHYELLNHKPHEGSQMTGEPQLDPLLQFDNQYLQQPNSFISEQQFKEFDDDMLFGNASQSYGHRITEERVHAEQNSWHLAEVQKRESDDDFARWMDDR